MNAGVYACNQSRVASHEEEQQQFRRAAGMTILRGTVGSVGLKDVGNSTTSKPSISGCSICQLSAGENPLNGRDARIAILWNMNADAGLL